MPLETRKQGGQVRKVILQEFVTLDGLAAGENGSVDFVPASTNGDESLGQRQIDFMDSIDTILLGRLTYEMFSEYWPAVTSGDDKPFADKINAIPKIVFSRTLDGAPWGDWGDAQIREDAAKEIAALKRRSGKDMVIWGSLSLAQSLMADRLIDEYQIIICPVVLGTGRPLFKKQSDAHGLELVDTRTFDRGTALLSYTTHGTNPDL
jgi:dihydrofolate reductase